MELTICAHRLPSVIFLIFRLKKYILFDTRERDKFNKPKVDIIAKPWIRSINSYKFPNYTSTKLDRAIDDLVPSGQDWELFYGDYVASSGTLKKSIKM